MLTLGRRLPKDSAMQNSVSRPPTDGLPCYLDKARDRLVAQVTTVPPSTNATSSISLVAKPFQYQPRCHRSV